MITVTRYVQDSNSASHQKRANVVNYKHYYLHYRSHAHISGAPNVNFWKNICLEDD